MIVMNVIAVIYFDIFRLHYVTSCVKRIYDFVVTNEWLNLICDYSDTTYGTTDECVQLNLPETWNRKIKLVKLS